MKKMVRIDLSALHELSPPEVPASDILSAILDKWDLKHRLLMNCSPEERVVLNEEFAEFIKGRADSEEKMVEEFARRKGAIPVKLFDGYEWAYALIL